MSVQTTSNSTVSQFGLHRTIDSRTERFLQLSKRRQIRQGCACAAVTAAITVTIVIVILLIFEYAIAVESNLVQIGERYRNLNDSIHINDTPVADRLDRTYLGFDQDYFEQMPLLVNAMQENSYNDPALETSILPSKNGRYLTTQNYTTVPTPQVDYRVIRKTSPRPFIFEYRSPTPAPFHKNFNSRSWIESYRNAQRLKNLEQVIKYLEKTINAKFGNLYTLPSNNHIAFSGVLKPASNEVKSFSVLDSLPQASYKVQSFQKANHQADPYFSFKPDSPGDVNLLADGQYKFSLVSNPSFVSKHAKRIPLFRPISHLKGCVGNQCNSQSLENKLLYSSKENSAEINSADTVPYDGPKSFNVMLNLLPLASTSNPYYTKQDFSDNIYFTTSRPLFQLRRKSVGSSNRRRVYVRRIKRPRLLSETTTVNNVLLEPISSENEYSSKEGAKVLLHVDVFPKTEELTTTTAAPSTTTTQTAFTPSQEIVYPPYVPTCPPLCAVEDYHIGSSGVIPVELRTYPTTQVMPSPPATTVTPFFDTTASSEQSHIWTTAPTEILRFSQEDARIPEEYKNYRTEEPRLDLQTEAIRRNSGSFEDDERKKSQDSIDVEEIDHNKNNSDHFEEIEDERRKTLIIKLRNYLESSTITPNAENSVNEDNAAETIQENKVTREPIKDSEKTTAFLEETTTIQTYVPQINGHYRSVNQNSKHINTWFEGHAEIDRKDRLDVLTTNGLKKTTPKYVEIHRNSHSDLNRTEQ